MKKKQPDNTSPAQAAKQAAQKAATPPPSKQHGAKPDIKTTPDAKPTEETSEQPEKALQSETAPAEKPVEQTRTPRQEHVQAPVPTIPINEEKPVERDKAPLQVFHSEYSFEVAYKVARQLSKAEIIPRQYQGEENIPNCLIALEMSQRLNVSPLAVMQNLYIVHGRPTWSGQWIIAQINNCGMFTPLRFDMVYDDNKIVRCVAWAKDIALNAPVYGPYVTWEMVVAEGWNVDKPLKSGGGVQKSKWNTMPDVMFRYRAASFFGKLYAPEILMGLPSSDELYDSVPVDMGQAELVTDNNADDVISEINKGE